MTALQLNAEIYRSLGVLSEDESMLKRAAKYLKKIYLYAQANNLLDAKLSTLDTLDLPFNWHCIPTSFPEPDHFKINQ